MSKRPIAVTRRIGTCAAAVALALAPAAALAQTNHGHARTASSTVIGSTHTKLGLILVDAHGHALYLFTGRSCTGKCANAWRPLLAAGNVLARSRSGVKQKLLGRARIAGGRLQVTYNHHALYLFSGDKRAGQLRGEGAHQFGGFWYVVGTRGNAIKPKQQGGGSVCNPVCPGY